MYSYTEKYFFKFCQNCHEHLFLQNTAENDVIMENKQQKQQISVIFNRNIQTENVSQSILNVFSLTMF